MWDIKKKTTIDILIKLSLEFGEKISFLEKALADRKWDCYEKDDAIRHKVFQAEKRIYEEELHTLKDRFYNLIVYNLKEIEGK